MKVSTVEAADNIDWEVTTFEGNRRAQQRKFMALSFRDKLQQLEDMAEVVAVIQGSGRGRGSPQESLLGGETHRGESRRP